MIRRNIERIHLLDFIRGIAIIAMVFHHAAFDLTTFYDLQIPFLETGLFSVIQTVVVLAFIIISGISTGFSRNSIRRGLIVLGAALIISLATLIITPEFPIRFGILHFMGSAMLLAALCKRALAIIPRCIALPLFAALFLVTKSLFPINVDTGYLFPFGLISNDFVSADYYPLIPWIFAFFFGVYLSKPLLEHKAPQWVYDFNIPFVNFCGRQTLWIFLLHQPIILGVLWLLFKIIPIK